MAANTNIDLVSLDFYDLKSSLKTYLKSQDQFKDYDFEGSNMNVLLDVLSLNTYKNAFYLNMSLAEGFLDSAQLIESVISHAKDLNYTPRSARSSKASISVSFIASSESAPYIIPKGSSFTAVIKNDSYIFSMPETITVSSQTNTFTFDADVYEGWYVQDSYVVDSNVENQRFKITNKNVDTSSISIVVKEDNSLIGDTYMLATSLLDLTESSKKYFLQASDSGFYEILFGDGVIGRKPKDGSVVIIEYRVCRGTLANGARAFTINFDPTGANELRSSTVITVSANSADGADSETLESVRYFAPRHFQTQERTVVASDYSIALKNEFPEISSISAYGGEELSPARYGKVAISINISNVNGLPESKKAQYYNFLKKRMPFSIDPIFIDPEFTYISVDSNVRYNINKTNSTRENIKALVSSVILNYNTTNLDDFDTRLRFSKLIGEIDDVDSSIISNDTSIAVYKKITPKLSTAQDIVVNFDMSLRDRTAKMPDKHLSTEETAVYSKLFTYKGENVILEDDGDGIIRLSKSSGGYNIKIQEVGTVNYETGRVQLTNFVIDSYPGSSFKIYAIPRDNDVVASRHAILTMEPEEIKINVEEVRE